MLPLTKTALQPPHGLPAIGTTSRSPADLAARQGLLAGWQWVLIMLVVSRLIIFGVIALARLVFVPSGAWHPGGVFSVLLQWDAELWYIGIARDGYTFDADFHSHMGFFPFYPLLVRTFSFVFTDVRVAGVVVSHVCLVAAALLFNALINVDYKDQRINRAAVTLLMFSPVSFFFSHAYSESTFLMLSLGAFLAAITKRWLLACLCGACLTATRNVGMLIAVPLFFEYWRQTWNPTVGIRSLLRPRILFFALIPMGFGMFMLYAYVKFGNPLAYLAATKVWGRQFVLPWHTLLNAFGLPIFYQWLFGTILLGGIVLWIASFYLKLRTSYLIYASLLVGIYLCGNSLEAIPRYLTVVFPLFITLGIVASRYPWSYLPMFAFSTAILTLCNILSAMGYWIT
ncbi:MAG TPA: mannosyltransferase family protein [Chthoniobacterales bacterium]|nr:mannosyltransferase family protein [Chthoniobacterales bacterium]